MPRLHELVVDLERNVPDPVERVLKAASGLSLDQPETDVGQMLATSTICSDIVDYQQEVILASGVDLSNHKRNAQIWFEHKEDPLYTLPLAMATDTGRRDGKHTVTRPDDFTLDGVSNFSVTAAHAPMAYQLFGMIDDGVIPATSVHVQPNPGGKAVYSDNHGNRYTVTEDSYLIEYSHCCVGVNPEALQKAMKVDSRLEPQISPALIAAVLLQADRAGVVLTRGTSGSHTLLEPLKKSLKAITKHSRSTLVNGETEKDDMSQKKSMTAEQITALKREALEAILGDDAKLAEYDSDTQAQMKGVYSKVADDYGGDQDEEEDDGDVVRHSDAEEEEQEPTSEEPQTKVESGDRKPGSMVLEDIYETLMMLTQKIEEMTSSVEEPNITKNMPAMLDQLRGMSAAFSGLHEKAYGKGFGNDAESAEEEEEDTSLKAQFKSFLADRKNQVETFKVQGIAGQLRRLSEQDGLSEGQKRQLRDSSVVLESIRKSAMAHQPGGVSQSDYDEVIAERDAAIAERDAAVAKAERAIEIASEVLPASAR